MMNGTTAIPAYDAIIESTKNAVVPMSSNTAITASAASTREHGPFSGRECVKKHLFASSFLLHPYFKCMKLVLCMYIFGPCRKCFTVLCMYYIST